MDKEWIGFLAVIIFLLIMVIKPRAKRKALPNEYVYQKIDALFTPAERSFLGVLDQVIPDNVRMFAKIRVADIITPSRKLPRNIWQKSFNKISAKHFDFILCHRHDLTIICAIELNDSSHDTKERNKRDVFLTDACNSANLPLIQIKARRSYNIGDLKTELSFLFDEPNHDPELSNIANLSATS